MVSNTPAQVVAIGGAALSTMGTFEGQPVGVFAFEVMFTGVYSFLELMWNSPGAKVNELSKMAYSEYYWFTIAEMKHFSLKMKSGHYQSNKTLSAAHLYSFLSDYASELLFERAQQHGRQKQQPSKPPPDINKVPQIEAILRENRQAYDKGLLTHEQYKHNYDVLIAEREYNLTKMATDEQVRSAFDAIIKTITDWQAEQKKEDAERLRKITQQEQARVLALAKLDSENKEQVLQMQREANERNKKLNEMMYKFTGIKDFKLNADATGDLRGAHQPDQQAQND